jgi:hypothetical protein
MPIFDVRITETLEKIVTVDAVDLRDACDIIEAEWCEKKHILDTDNFTGVEFTCV